MEIKELLKRPQAYSSFRKPPRRIRPSDPTSLAPNVGHSRHHHHSATERQVEIRNCHREGRTERRSRSRRRPWDLQDGRRIFGVEDHPHATGTDPTNRGPYRKTEPGRANGRDRDELWKTRLRFVTATGSLLFDGGRQEAVERRHRAWGPDRDVPNCEEVVERCSHS